MQLTMQIALTVASVAFIALVCCIIPVLCLTRRKLNGLLQSVDQLESKVEGLVDNSNDLIHSVNELSKQINQQMPKVSERLDTVHHWAARANRRVDEVGSVIEPPAFTIAHYANMIRKGASAFFSTLKHGRST